MAKKIVLIVLFSILVFCAYLQYDFLHKNGDAFIDMIVEIEKDISEGNYDSAEIKADEFTRIWEKTKPIYEMLCEHEEVDKIQSCVEQFNVLLVQKDPFVFTQTGLLKYYYDHIVKIDSFSFENIF